MGVGAPEDMVEGRGARHRHLRLRAADPRGPQRRPVDPPGRLNLRNARYAADPLPVEPGCDCYSCQHFSRAYLRHLFKAGRDPGAAPGDGTQRPLHDPAHGARSEHHIAAGTFPAFREQFLADYQLSNQEVRHAPTRTLCRPPKSGGKIA